MQIKSHLNGAFYGPSIPRPPPQQYCSPVRAGSSSSCGGGGCCLISLLAKLLAAAAILTGLAVLIFWLIFQPVNKVRYRVTGVILTEFNLTNNNTTLNYNFALNVTVRNPNKKIGIYYERIEVSGFYKAQRFGSQFFGPFYQGYKSTTILNPVLNGQQLVVLGSKQMGEFDKEMTDGVFNIGVQLNLKIRFKLGQIKTASFKPKIKCKLNVPLNGRLDDQTTKCIQGRIQPGPGWATAPWAG